MNSNVYSVKDSLTFLISDNFKVEPAFIKNSSSSETFDIGAT